MGLPSPEPAPLPRRLTLPSGRVVSPSAWMPPGERRPAPGSPLFEEALSALGEDIALSSAGELDFTLEHELEHHRYFLEGEDPMDEDEHAAIGREAARVLGRRELVRAEVRTLTRSLGDFGKRTWPLWLILVAASIAAIYAER